MQEEAHRVEATFEVDGWNGEPWSVSGATCRESLNEPFELDLELMCPESDADATSLLGESCSMVLTRRGVETRVCGIVTRVKQAADALRRTVAYLLVEPALVASRHRSDTRIFQEMSVPEIVSAVLQAPLAAFGRSLRTMLAASYPPREYCVQFRETDFDFVHRLLEEEGIGYRFEHEQDREVLELFDAPAHYRQVLGETADRLGLSELDPTTLDTTEGIGVFDLVTQIRPNKFVTRHFDWTRPAVPIEASDEVLDPSWPVLESYVTDAPLTFSGFDQSYSAHNAAAQTRLVAERARRDVRRAEGRGSCLDLRAGRRFVLEGHRRGELDGDWMVARVVHRFGEHASPSEEQGRHYLDFSCLPADVVWRPERVRDRPRIHGVQTATVVGPAGEEIHTDPHGRIKVQFHWDRLGTLDDKSSCWVRVVQSMGGPGWGASFIPRIGQEVAVTFIEGSLDSPLITGSIYNGAQPSPLDLPADKTRFTLKTNSSPGGSGFNELRFEDLAGSEEIWLHGERDWNTVIKHDLTRRVDNDESQEVVHDRSRRVGHDEKVMIGNCQEKLVQVDETEVVGQNRTRQVGATEKVAIGADREKTIANDETVSIGANAKETIGQNLVQSIALNATQSIGMNLLQNVALSAVTNVVVDHSLSVGGRAKRKIGNDLDETVGGNLSQRVKKNRTTTVGLIDQLTVTGARNVTVGLASAEQVALTKSVVAGQSISLQCGDSSLTLNADGTIELKGTQISIAGEDEVAVVAALINLN